VITKSVDVTSLVRLAQLVGLVGIETAFPVVDGTAGLAPVVNGAAGFAPVVSETRPVETAGTLPVVAGGA